MRREKPAEEKGQRGPDAGHQQHDLPEPSDRAVDHVEPRDRDEVFGLARERQGVQSPPYIARNQPERARGAPVSM